MEPLRRHLAEWGIARGQLDNARALSESSPEMVIKRPLLWLPLDVALTGDTSRTLDQIESSHSLLASFGVMHLQRSDRWVSRHGGPHLKKAFAALRQEPRYQQALIKYGIDKESLAKIQVHTDELWD